MRTKQMEQFETVGITQLVSVVSGINQVVKVSDLLAKKLGASHFHPTLRSALRTIEQLGYGSTMSNRWGDDNA